MDWLLIGETALPWFLRLSAWWTIAQVALGLGFVIFVHELGHFMIAKLCGVKCEKFYVGFDVPLKLGFGKYAVRLPSSLWKKTWGETTYGIGILPLGGYVKMLGQDDNPARAAEAMRRAKEAQEAREKGQPLPADYDPEDDYVLDPRSYMAQSVPERMGIISAGVIMNMIFAFIFAVIAFAMGVDYVPCIIGKTVPGDPAWLAGLQPGDEITEIGGTRKPRFKDLQVAVILGDIEQGITAKVEPIGGDKTVDVVFKPDAAKNQMNLRPTIGVVMAATTRLNSSLPVIPGTVAAKSDQFKPGDNIVEINGESTQVSDDPATNYLALEAILARNENRSLEVVVERIKQGDNSEQPATERHTVTLPPTQMRWFGMTMKMGPLSGVQPGSPAAAAVHKTAGETIGNGLMAGDRLVSIDGQPIGNPVTLPERMRTLATEKPEVEVVVRRQIGDSSRELTFGLTLRDAPWSPTVVPPDCAMEVPTMGVCYPVESIVQQVAADSPAAKAGIKAGDVVTAVDFVAADDEQLKVEVGKYSRFKETFQVRVRDKGEPDQDNWLFLVRDVLPQLEPDTKLKLHVHRDGAAKPLHITVLPTDLEGFFLAERGFHFASNYKVQQAESFTDALYLGYRETFNAAAQVVIFLKKLTTGQVSVKLLGGPGTIVAVAGSQANRGFPEFLVFLTLLSANLAVVNFLPIPVLDGGHMMFLLAELVTGKPVSERVQTPLMYLGLFMILGLMIFVIGLDVQRFWPFG